MELTPEERQRIYEEEETRIEARDTLKAEKCGKWGRRVGVAFLVVLGWIGLPGGGVRGMTHPTVAPLYSPFPVLSPDFKGRRGVARLTPFKTALLRRTARGRVA